MFVRVIAAPRGIGWGGGNAVLVVVLRIWVVRVRYHNGEGDIPGEEPASLGHPTVFLCLVPQVRVPGAIRRHRGEHGEVEEMSVLCEPEGLDIEPLATMADRVVVVLGVIAVAIVRQVMGLEVGVGPCRIAGHPVAVVGSTLRSQRDPPIGEGAIGRERVCKEGRVSACCVPDRHPQKKSREDSAVDSACPHTDLSPTHVAFPPVSGDGVSGSPTTFRGARRQRTRGAV